MEANTKPAGLDLDNSSEIFVENGEPVLLFNGRQFSWGEFPIEILAQILHELNHDMKVRKGLALLGIEDPDDRLKLYTFCRFGDFDKVPDVDSFGNIRGEYWDCGRRPCPADGLLCRLPEVVNGSLTSHDAAIIRLVAQDLPNKTIADRMGVQVQTMNRQVKNIAHKISCYTKSGIASFAGQNNII